MTAVPVAIMDEGKSVAAAAESQFPWRRFVWRFLGLLLAILVLIAGMNFLVNPMGIYPVHLLPTVTWNTRAIKPELLDRDTPKPQALIVGSSRSMQISPVEVQKLTGLPAFNASVDAAMAEDYYLMLRYAVERAGVTPKLVILGVDVEAFHNKLPIEDRTMETNAFNGLLPGHGFSAWKKFYKLFVAQQTHLSLRSLRVQLTGHAPQRNYFDPDGYLHYGEYEQERASGHYDLDAKIQKDIASYVERTAGYSAISPERREFLEKTLQYCHDRNIRVVLWVTPLGPRLLQALGPRGYDAREREVLDMLHKLGARYGDPVYDLSSVDKFYGDPNGFWDGAHMTEHNNSLVTRLILGRRTDAVQ